MHQPGIYRIGVVTRSIGTIIAVALVVFVLGTGYSAAELHASVTPLGNPEVLAMDAVALRANISVSNPGLLPLSSLVVVAEYRFGGPDGPLVGVGSSPAASLPGQDSAVIAFAVTVPFGASLPTSLLTQDAVLPG